MKGYSNLKFKDLSLVSSFTELQKLGLTGQPIPDLTILVNTTVSATPLKTMNVNAVVSNA